MTTITQLRRDLRDLYRAARAAHAEGNTRLSYQLEGQAIDLQLFIENR